MYTHAYAHENTCECLTPSTRWSTDTKTHNLCTNMHTHTHTHVYKRIDVQMHTHMHIYTYITSAHIHTYTYIHTLTQNVHMNARKARLKRRRGSDCVVSPNWHQEALPFSLSASRQRAVQTTSAYLHWCGADPPSSPAPSLAMAPRNEVIFLLFWRGFLLFLCCARNLWSASTLGRRQLALVCCAQRCPAGCLRRSRSDCPNSLS